MISILMPIYNGIEFIEDSVSSILSQTYGKWELLIGINGHPENSEVYLLAKEYEKRSDKIRVIDFYNSKGKSNTLNDMIPFCNYDFVALLDVDDMWHNKKLEIQSPLLDRYDVVGSKCIYFGDRPGIVPNIPIEDLLQVDFKKVNPIINSSSIIRKPLCYWKDNGIEDYDLWLRLKEQNKQFYNCPQILVKHRIHTASAFNSKGHTNQVNELLKSISTK